MSALLEELRNLPDSMVRGRLTEIEVTASSTALMVIDMQNQCAHPDWGNGARAKAKGLTGEMDYYFSRLDEVVVPNTQRLLQECRNAKLPVVHVRVMGQAADGSDVSWRFKQRKSTLVLPDSPEAQFLESVAPAPGELVFNKTTSGVFHSTNADFVLRNMGIDTLIMTGVVTCGCVETSARTAADIGYRVILVEDACAAWSEEAHRNALLWLHTNYAVVQSTDETVAAIAQATKPAMAGAL